MVSRTEELYRLCKILSQYTTDIFFLKIQIIPLTCYYVDPSYKLQTRPICHRLEISMN